MKCIANFLPFSSTTNHHHDFHPSHALVCERGTRPKRMFFSFFLGEKRWVHESVKFRMPEKAIYSQQLSLNLWATYAILFRSPSTPPAAYLPSFLPFSTLSTLLSQATHLNFLLVAFTLQQIFCIRGFHLVPKQPLTFGR